MSNKLLQSVINGDQNIFDTIKKMRKPNTTKATCIDGHTENICDYFADKYHDLYNSVDDNNDMNTIYSELNSSINQSTWEDIYKVAPAVVKNAISHLKPSKSDSFFDFSTDCFKNADDILFYHISNIFMLFLSHGHISSFLLISSLVPLIKDKMGSKSNSKNYRSIEISSILLKIFVWVMIILFKDE